MTIQDGFAADTIGGGVVVVYETVFTEICYPNLGIKSEATAVYPNAEREKPPKRGKAKREDERQPTLF